MKDEDRNDSLVAAASGLATEIAPERDLWPGVAERISRTGRPRRMRWFAQAAAVVVLVGASSGLTVLMMKDDAPPASLVTPELTLQPVSMDGRYAPGPAYVVARNDMVAELDEELARLSPETRADVERNLALIRAAIAEINTALEDEPTNPNLQQLLLRAYQDEMTLMHRVGDLTRYVMSRSDI